MVNALPQYSVTQKPFIPYMVSHGFDIHMVLYVVLSIKFHNINHLERCSLTTLSCRGILFKIRKILPTESH